MTGLTGATCEIGATGPAGPGVGFSTGSGTIPPLIIAQTANVVVPLSPAQPDTGYFVLPTVNGPSDLLGNLQVQGVVSKTTTSVTVTVRNSGLLGLAGGTLQVVALRPA